MVTDPTVHFGPIQIELLPSQLVASLRVLSSSPEEEAAAQMERWLAEEGLGELAGRPHFGFDAEVSHEQQQEGIRGYEVWYPVPESARPSGPVQALLFPGGLYAVMRLRNPFVDPFKIIPAGWEHLVQWGCKNEAYHLASHQGLERFIPDPAGPHLDLYLPVEANPVT